MKSFFIFLFFSVIICSNGFSQSKSQKDNEVMVKVGISEKDFLEGRYLTEHEDENGVYWKMPKGVMLDVSVKKGEIEKTVQLKEGMTRETVAKILTKVKISGNRIGLIFSHNKLVGKK